MHARGLQLGGVATSKAQTWSSEGDMNPKNGGKPYKGAKLEGKVSKMRQGARNFERLLCSFFEMIIWIEAS